MHISHIALLALASRQAQAYLDTSPFFMFSTNDLRLPSSQLQSGSKLTSSLISTLSRCPSDFYLLVHQPFVSLSDFPSPNAAPCLEKHLSTVKSSHIPFAAIIPEVSGNIDLGQVEKQLMSDCGAHSSQVAASGDSLQLADHKPQVLNLRFPVPSEAQPERAQDILDHDKTLSSLLSLLARRNYTVIYTTSPNLPSSSGEPNKEAEYEMSSSSERFFNTDLKRDLHANSRRSIDNNVTLVDGPLFERYQFLSPGLFMGLLVSLVLLSILYVAISAIASLQVSYAAFDKENGPGAAGGQKKG